jgi:hypothetical protein
MLDIVALRRIVYNGIGIEYGDEDLPVVEVDLLLNRSFWELQNKFPFKEQEVLETFETAIGVRNYQKPLRTDSIYHLAIVADDEPNQHIPLIQITVDEYETLYQESEEQWNQPIKYTLENCIIRMWPTPDLVYTINMRRRMILADLSASNAVPQIPPEWHEIIAYGALWRAFIDKSDYTRSQIVKRQQTELISNTVPTEAKEAGINRQYARFKLPAREY